MELYVTKCDLTSINFKITLDFWGLEEEEESTPLLAPHNAKVGVWSSESLNEESTQGVDNLYKYL